MITAFFLVLGCLSFHAPLAHAATTWTGNTSTAWGTASNWSSGVPTSGDDVTIPSAPTGGRWPTMSSGTYATKKLTLQTNAIVNHTDGTLQIYDDFKTAAGCSYNGTGGAVQFAANGAGDFSLGMVQFYHVIVDAGVDPKFDGQTGSVVRIAGNYTNNNTGLDDDQNKVLMIFNGTGAQSIYSAASSGKRTFGNLQVDKASGTVTLTSTVEIGGDATVTNGTFDLGSQTFSRTASGGVLTVSNSGTLRIGGTHTMPTIFTTRTFSSTSTVEYYGTHQTVTGETYGNLTLSGSGTKTAAAASTINGNFTINAGPTFNAGSYSHNVKGDFSNSGTFTASSGTMTLSGTSAQAIAGSSTTTFNNLTIANSSATVLVNSNFNANGTLTVNASASLTPAAAVVVGGSGTLTGSGTVYVTRTAATPDFVSQYTITNKTLTNLIVNYYATGAQTINALNYGNLTISGARTTSSVTFASSGIVGIAGSLTLSATFSSGGYVLTGSTVNYNGGSAQAVGALNYNNLTLSTSGTKTFASGTTGIAGVLTVSGSATANTTTNSTTVNYNGSGAQTVIAINYYSLTFSNAGTKTFASGTSGIASSLTVSGSASADATTNAPTIAYNGSGAQTVVNTNYHHLTVSGGNTKTPAAGLSVAGNFTIGASTTLAAGSYAHSIKGTFSNSGTFTASTSTVTLNGTSSQAISGSSATTFNNLTVNNSAGVTLSSNCTVNGTLTFTSGNITTGSYTLALGSSGSVSRTSGHVVGKFQKYVSTGATSRTFEVGDAAAYSPIDVTFGNVTVAGNLIASVTAGSHPQTNTSPVDQSLNVNKYYTLTNSGTTFTNYNATFNFVSGDLDPGTNTSLFMIARYSSGSWTSPTIGTRTSTSTQATALTGFGDFEVGQPQSVSVQVGSSVSSLTWSHTVSSLANRVMIVGVNSEHSAATQPTGVTYNGSNLTLIGSASAGTSIYQNVSLWYLLAPSTGTANVVVTWSSTVNQGTAGAFVLYGMAQIAPEASATSYNNSGATSTNITTVADSSYVVDIFGSGQDQGDLTSGTGQTTKFINAAGSTTTAGGSTKIVGTAGTTSMYWTQTGINRSAAVVASFAPALFYSKGNLAVSTASNWNTRRDGAGTNAPSFGADARWSIQNTHSMTLSGSTSWNLGSAGYLTIENGGTWTNTSSGSVTLGTLRIDNGGTYSHGTNNALPGTAKSFDATSTVSYTGSSQTVEALEYGHLTIASSGTRTLGGNASVAGNLTVSGGILDLSSCIADRSSAGGTLTLSNGATLKIGGTNTFPANYSTVSLGATSTTEYHGSVQTVSSQAYGHLTLSNGSTKTAGDSLVIVGDFTIGSGTNYSAGDYTHVVQGNWSNGGTFDPSDGTIMLTGSSNTQITGATTFHALTVNKSSAATTVTLNNNVSTSHVAMTQGKIVTGSNAITVTSDRTGNGWVIGTITRTHTFNASTSYAFEGPYQTLTFDGAGSLPTSVTVTTTLSSPGANDYMEPITRNYTISQSGGSDFAYSLRLHYEDSEVSNPNSETSPPLKIWRRTTTGPDVWTREGATSNNTTNNWVEQTGLTTMGTFSLSSRTVAEMTLTLSANAANPIPGQQVTYTIAYSNTGDGTSTNTLVTAAAPANTTYVASSTTVNSVAKTDAADADEVTVSGSTITINLGSVAASGSGTITYQVAVN